MRFHQGSQYYRQIRVRNAGFRFTAGDTDTLTDIYAASIYGNIFYDNDNTAYYVNPAGATSGLFSGSVGIGTTSPSQKLNVFGNIRVDGDYVQIVNASSPSLYLNNVSVQWRAYMPTGLNNFAINDSARDVLTLGYNGGNSYFQGCNVGIGTTSPGARLDVNVGVAKTDTTAFGYPSLILRSNESSNFSNLGINFIGGASQANRGFQFQTGESGITNSGNILFQPYGGNVGIGTTSPNAKLNVVSSGTKSTISIGNTAASTYSQLLMYGGASRYNWSIGAQYNVTDGLEITPSTATEGTTFSTPAVTILQTGRVGIGTTTPGQALDVNGRIRIGSNAQTEIYSSSNRVVFRGENTDNVAQFAGYGLFLPIAGQSYNLFLAGSANFGYTDTTATLDIHRGNTGPFIRLNSNGTSYLNGGNVGIGTTTPGNLLEVRSTTAGASVARFTDSNRADLVISFPSSGYSTFDSYVGGSGGGFTFRAATSELVRITSAGRVGIGGTSPAYLLDVFGPIASEAGEKDDITTRTKAGFWETSTATTGEGWPTTTNSYYHLISSTHLNTANYYSLQIASPFFTQNFYIRATNGSGTTGWSSIVTGAGTTNYVPKWASSTTLGNSVIYDDGTNVGIGTTSPAYKLDVNGIIGLSGFRFADKEGNYNRIFEPAGNTAMYLGNASDPGNYYDNTSHNFRNRGGSTFYMVINSSGNVGIGVTSPSYPLEVASTNALSIAYQRTGVAAKKWGFQSDNDSTYWYNITDNVLALTVRNTGDVGIGTTSPAYKLHIERTDGTDTRMLIRNTSTGNAGIELAGGGGNQYIDFTPASSTDFEGRIIYSSSSDEMQFMTNITNRFKLNSNGAEVQNGALGVGVAASATDGRIDASNDIVSFSSDKRLKTNIQLIENPLDKIGKLSGFTYNWNEKANELANYDTNESLVGVFAQEVQAVLPEAVKLAPFDNDGNDKSISGENYLTVQYEKIVPLLIEAIKEQQQQIYELKYLLQNK
jgi:hypothetical protein